MAPASTAEGMQLDKSAGGSMGIEWGGRLALSGVAEECAVVGEWSGKKVWPLVVGREGARWEEAAQAGSLSVIRAVG